MYLYFTQVFISTFTQISVCSTPDIYIYFSLNAFEGN